LAVVCPGHALGSVNPAQVHVESISTEVTMLRVLIAFTALVLAGGVNAQGTAQKDRMNTCERQATAKHLKYDERQEFVKACMTGTEPQDVKRWGPRR
jgi:hypothetical protein